MTKQPKQITIKIKENYIPKMEELIWNYPHLANDLFCSDQIIVYSDQIILKDHICFVQLDGAWLKYDFNTCSILIADLNSNNVNKYNFECEVC